MEFESVIANVDYNVIGKRIRKARNKKGISQEVLSEWIGVSTAYISRIERRSSNKFKKVNSNSKSCRCNANRTFNWNITRK